MVKALKNKVWKYNPDSNTWTTFETLPEDLVAPVARIIDGRLIVAGGGAPVARRATNRVHSILVDNNPPVLQPDPPQAPAPGSDTPEGPTLISMEAEYFDLSTETSTHQWVNVALGNSSNDAAMITTPDQGDLADSTENTPMLSYLVHFNYPGKHYIWVRGLGDTDETGVGNSDSLQVGLNGTLASTAYQIDQFPNEWTWSRRTPSEPAASLNVVDAGVNMVNLWMREDGLAIDKFVITSDPDFSPEGFGPEVTDGTNDYMPPSPAQDINTNPTDEETINTDTAEQVDSLSNDPDETGEMVEVGETDGIDVPRNDETSSADPSIGDSSSEGGIFGGNTSVLTLFLMLLVWAARYRSSRFA